MQRGMLRCWVKAYPQIGARHWHPLTPAPLGSTLLRASSHLGLKHTLGVLALVKH